MAIQERKVAYRVDGETHDGLLARDASRSAPTILVFHGWEGRSTGQDAFCDRLVAAGFQAFAVDLYGAGKTGVTPEECSALMSPFMSDRGMLRDRLAAQVEVLAALPDIDATRLGAIGFCFGGLCTLDLARAGAPLKAVASFHGLFNPPTFPVVRPIQTKILALHGWDDPLVPPQDAVALGAELTEGGADWQLQAHGGAVHAFMNAGPSYNAITAPRAWASMLNFMGEVFDQSP